MSLRLNRMWLLPALLIAGECWALGLGDIRLSSALNEPLRAEIELLSVTPEEVSNLKIQLASSETFERYGIDRPLFLTSMKFEVVSTAGGAGTAAIRVTTPQPVSEPFVTFLVEASWSRGRLLREYTLLLDPPTFAPPPAQQGTQALAAPSRATPADSGTIQRAAPQPAAPPRASPPPPPPPRQVEPRAQPPQQTGPFDTSEGGEYRVRRGDTLWGIAQRVRPDERLNTNQTMIAIYEANQQAFAGNINVMSAGATLRIPSADQIFRISRGQALNEVRRQTQVWSGDAGGRQSGPSLTLVPPEGEDSGFDGTVSQTSTSNADASARDRIRQLEQQIAEQDSLLEIRDNELAALRDQLARLRGERLVPDGAPGIDEPVMTDEAPAGADEVFADEETPDTRVDDAPAVDDSASDDARVSPAAEQRPAPTVVVARPPKPGIVDTVLGAVMSIWGAIGAALLVVLGILVWFARRAGRDEEDSTGVWEPLEDGDVEGEALASTERLRALAQDDNEAILVVEQESAPRGVRAEPVKSVEPTETADATSDEIPFLEQPDALQEISGQVATDTSRTLEDTFSSDTAINLDQSDPIAEADFHMAYGLYDQAADLINGALGIEPERDDLLAKLCEIYFVWGNRDGFIDAAQRMRARLSEETAPEWDKIVIMGQQIAADHELFAGVTAGTMTQAVDLSFEGALDQASELDMNFAGGGPDGAVSDVIDLGADSDDDSLFAASHTDSAVLDFPFGDEDVSSGDTAQMNNPSGKGDTVRRPVATTAADDATVETDMNDETAESPGWSSADRTVETPTIEQQFESLDATSELPALTDDEDAANEFASLDDDRPAIDATAEINLDDLGLDLEALDNAELADDVLDDVSDEIPLFGMDDNLQITGANEALDQDVANTTGKNPQVDDFPESTGMHEALNVDPALVATSEMPGIRDRTGENATLDDEDDDVFMDSSLLDATGQTQILPEDYAVGSALDTGDSLADDDKTMLAQGIDDETLAAPLADLEDDSDLASANTQELPRETLRERLSADETGERPGIAGATDMDLDLDDLTAALQVSSLGDTIEQPLDDKTVKHPRYASDQDLDLDVGSLDEFDDGPTQALSPDDVSGDLHDARTMTEVGTKLDLARAYVDMGDPAGARSILEEVLEEGDAAQRQQAQQLLETLPA